MKLSTWFAVIILAVTGTALISSCSSTPTTPGNNNPTSTNTSTITLTPNTTGSPTPTPTKTPTNSPTNSPTNTAVNTATNSPTNSATNSPTATVSNSPTNSATLTTTSTPSNSATSTPTATISNTPTITSTPTNTSTITSTPTNTATMGPTNTGNVSTLSTSGTLNYPNAVALDSLGNLYVPNNALQVQEISGGVTSLVAGNGASGYSDGPASIASFGMAEGLAVDSTGNVFIADASNNEIREVTINSAPVSLITFAGQRNPGYLDLTGTAAEFHNPYCLAIDKYNNVYVGDQYNSVIRVITPGGVVSTFAGAGYSAPVSNGPANIATFNGIAAIALDNSGNLYVAESGAYDVRKITVSAGSTVVSTLAGDGNPGFNNANGTSAEFNYPSGVAVDSYGNVYVSDSNNQLIRKITPSGDVSTLAGQYLVHGTANGLGTAAQFYSPEGLAIDLNGTLYVGDAGNNLIRVIQ